MVTCGFFSSSLPRIRSSVSSSPSAVSWTTPARMLLTKNLWNEQGPDPVGILVMRCLSEGLKTSCEEATPNLSNVDGEYPHFLLFQCVT